MPGRKAPEAERREQILRAAFDVATRDRLDGLTVRAVAAEANLSPGLVFFHFRSKDALLLSLLDWLLSTTLNARLTPEIAGIANPHDRLLALLRTEIVNLPAERAQVELFFDYWVRGTRHPEIRHRIREALARYREVFRGVAAEALEGAPQPREASTALTPDGAAGLAVSLIEGCAVQAVIDPDHFDVTELLRQVSTVVRRLPAPDTVDRPNGPISRKGREQAAET